MSSHQTSCMATRRVPAGQEVAQRRRLQLAVNAPGVREFICHILLESGMSKYMPKRKQEALSPRHEALHVTQAPKRLTARHGHRFIPPGAEGVLVSAHGATAAGSGRYFSR